MTMVIILFLFKIIFLNVNALSHNCLSVVNDLLILFSQSKFYLNLFFTTYRSIIGCILGEIISVTTAIFINRYMVIKKTIKPLLTILQHTPTIAFVPLIILIAPSSESSIWILTTFSAFLSTINNNIDLFSSISTWNRYYVSLFSKNKIMSILNLEKIYFIRDLDKGFVSAFSASWISVVVAEVLSGTSGLGFALWQSFNILNITQMIAYLLVIVLWGEVIRIIIKFICKKYEY